MQLGTLYDLRPLVFSISELVIIVGVFLVFKGIARRRVYLLGIALMATYLIGYVVWQTVLDHGASGRTSKCMAILTIERLKRLLFTSLMILVSS